VCCGADVEVLFNCYVRNEVNTDVLKKVIFVKHPSYSIISDKRYLREHKEAMQN